MLIDRIIGIVAVVLAAVYLYATAQIPTLEIGDPLGPKAFPILLGIALIVAAILLIFETLKKDGAPVAAAPRESLRHLWLMGGVTAWTALYFGVFDRVGYLVSTTVYLLVMTVVFNRGKSLANVLTSVLWSVGSYLLFVKILGVMLPAGILGFWERDMDTLGHILNGFNVALMPINLWYTFLGCFMGTIIGVLPGIGPAAGIGLLIPITFGMDPTSALIMMAGIYYGAMYGGSTTSILINTPGEASSVMTALDGYQMAKNGRAGAALAVSAIGSFIAGTFGIVALTMLAVPLAAIALEFGPAEYFCLMLFALAAVSSLTGKSAAKGLMSTVLGLMVATIGIDLQSGQPRYTMGVPELQDGVGFLVVVVGLFAIGEVFSNLEEHIKGKAEIIRLSGKLWLTKEEWRRSIMPIMRGGLIGFFKGVLPGAGATIATMISYTVEKRVSKHPERFGTGMIEGVAGPEAANNAATCGAMVPLLTLGIPGSGATAVLMGAFIMYGIQPGPLLFEKRPDLVWGLVDSMYIGNIMLLILNLPLVPLFVRILYIPTGILLSLILAISSIGIYSINGNTLELQMALMFGVIGYIFRKIDIPLAPMVLALVLGGIMEQSFRQAMTISGADPRVFVRGGICITLLVLAVVMVLLPVVLPRLRQLKEGPEDLES